MCALEASHIWPRWFAVIYLFWESQTDESQMICRYYLFGETQTEVLTNKNLICYSSICPWLHSVPTERLEECVRPTSPDCSKLLNLMNRTVLCRLTLRYFNCGKSEPPVRGKYSVSIAIALKHNFRLNLWISKMQFCSWSPHILLNF